MKAKARVFWLSLLLSLAANAELAAAEPTIVGVASVIDGDTLEIHAERIRLHGIDAPESSQLCARLGTKWRCGQHAALALADKIGGSTVRCEGSLRDRYGRLIAVCFKDSENLNRWMIANGWAVAFRRYSQDYVDDEDQARSARRGIWSGTFDMPWDWRAGIRR